MYSAVIRKRFKGALRLQHGIANDVRVTWAVTLARFSGGLVMSVRQQHIEAVLTLNEAECIGMGGVSGVVRVPARS